MNNPPMGYQNYQPPQNLSGSYNNIAPPQMSQQYIQPQAGVSQSQGIPSMGQPMASSQQMNYYGNYGQ